MVRLDFARATSLTEPQVGRLWEYVITARDNDRNYFRIMKQLRMLHKTGTQGELKHMDKHARVVANLAHAHVSALRPTLFFKEPTVEATPTHPRHENKAPAWESLINNLNKRTGFKKEIKYSVTDAIVYPEAWVKSFINVVEAEETDKPGSATVGPTTEEGRFGVVEWMTKGAPAIARVAPTQVVVDYMSADRSLENARFVDIMYVKHMEELLKDKRYSEVASQLQKNKAFLKSGKSRAMNPTTDPFALSGEDFWEVRRVQAASDHLVILHEIWVYQLVELKLYKQLVVLVEGADGIMVNKPIRMDNWEDDKVLGKYGDFYPITRLAINEVPDMRPNSELGVWSSLHAAVNWILSRIISFVDSEKQLWYVNEDAVTNKDVVTRAIKSGSTRELIFGKGPSGIEAVSNFNAGRDNYSLLANINEFIRRIGGIGENREGLGEQFRTATEASAVEQGIRIKIDEKRALISDFLQEIIEKEIKLIRHLVEKSGTTEFVFKIAGDTGAVEWLNFTSDDVNWHPDIDIKVHSFIKPTRQEEIQKASMALEAGIRLKAFHPELRTDVLYRQLLEALELSEIGKIVDNAQDHAMVQAVEIAMIMASPDADPPVTPDQNHAVHSQVIQMFINSPEAQAIAEENPQAFDALLQHKAKHDAALEQVQGGVQQATPSGKNPFDDLNAGPEGGSPANVSRSQTAQDRETNNRLAGTGGQLG